MKTRTVFKCSSCGQEALGWMGQCPGCSNWNTLQETQETRSPDLRRASPTAIRPLSSIFEESQRETLKRFSSGLVLLDNALGGGLLQGSLLLLGGAPGVGKSTLAGQISSMLAQDKRVFYVSGEEEAGQVAVRLQRLGIKKSQDFFIASSLDIEEILLQSEELEPQVLIVDSVQTIASSELEYPSGSPSLIRLITSKLLHLAKAKKAIVLLLGHITKEGNLAGPKHLEHIVDVVLNLEKPRSEEFRLLRVTKNRFGPTNHLVVFKMEVGGLKEVADPSESFLSGAWREKLKQETAREALASSIALDGGQPFLIQIEALIGKKRMSPGKRTSVGIDRQRLEMLLAVLEKSLRVSLEMCDVFVSCLGGMRVRDPGVDLAVVASAASAMLEIPLKTQSLFLGEVSLSGDILVPKDLEIRIRQAKALGFQEIYYANDRFGHIREFIAAIRNKKEV